MESDKRACDRGDQRACVRLGQHRLNPGEAADGQPHEAANLFAQACIAGAGAGCTWLASLYMDGTGVPKDEARAKGELFRWVAAADHKYSILD
jgi:TPR repeat protein